jgi:hypothetical protein
VYKKQENVKNKMYSKATEQCYAIGVAFFQFYNLYTVIYLHNRILQMKVHFSRIVNIANIVSLRTVTDSAADQS